MCVCMCERGSCCQKNDLHKHGSRRPQEKMQFARVQLLRSPRSRRLHSFYYPPFTARSHPALLHRAHNKLHSVQCTPSYLLYFSVLFTVTCIAHLLAVPSITRVTVRNTAADHSSQIHVAAHTVLIYTQPYNCTLFLHTFIVPTCFLHARSHASHSHSPAAH